MMTMHRYRFVIAETQFVTKKQAFHYFAFDAEKTRGVARSVALVRRRVCDDSS
jgi:hypothetical protein